MQASVSELTVYPIKSSAGISLTTAWVDEYGLAFDRRFVICDSQGQFITARTENNLCLIRTSLTPQGLMVIAPDMPVLQLNYHEFAENYTSVQVWNDKVKGQVCSKDADAWFSQYLKKECRLLFFGSASQRKVKNAQQETAFTDGYPLLLISQASLDALNNKLKTPVAMANFRPNIVVDDCEAFAEDTWKHIRIGEVEFMVSKPCSRCVFTTVDPETAHKSLNQEPLKTLKTFRQTFSGDVMFGQNLIQLNQGQIKNGDTVTVLSKQEPPKFLGKTANKKGTPAEAQVTTSSLQTPEAAPATQHKAASPKAQGKVPQKVTVDFAGWNKSIVANTKESVLDQGEEAGLLLPYSCRGGMCGRCKMKLVAGDVKVLADDGLHDSEKSQGYILACSSIPQSDIVVDKP